ncbi:AEC family transporter [Coleofasciculus sp. H7-2]|uniref:AEC family transporter n=1 Tax=Coleofasciculus sp. H7-2 TaxID=3351545 RepID=UPI00366E683F
MTETLFHAYTPIILWTGLGIILFRFIPSSLPRLLGRSLYWVGVPLQILTLARQANLSENAGVVPLIAMTALAIGFSFAWLSLQVWKRFSCENGESKNSFLLPFLDRSRQGSFILSAMLGNTGFVGLAIAPSLISTQAFSLAVFYSVTNNIIGTYGIGVFIASYFGRPAKRNHWWIQIRDILSVPSLWTFSLGYLTRSVELPTFLESGLQASVDFVIASSFVLMGIRLAQLQGWKSFQVALLPALVKVVVMPGLVGIAATLVGLSGDARLAMILMAGVPTAFASLILAEEYDLDPDLAASSIVVSIGLLLLMIPLWLLIYG